MKFSKMHGLSNDFMIVDNITQNISFSTELICRLSNRRLGVGFDQLLIVEPPYYPDFDFHYKIFNADGSEVFQCGNGARCFALFVKLKGLTNKNYIKVSTKTEKIILEIINENTVRVNMGIPNFEPIKVPFDSKIKKNNYSIDFHNQKIFFDIVSIGNPHCVIQVDNIHQAPINVLGPFLEKHKKFPQHVNVGFMEIINRKYIRLRVYERGVGETKACGSGACAAVAIGIKQRKLENKVDVELFGGILNVFWKNFNNSLFMTGNAVHVYDGKII